MRFYHILHKNSIGHLLRTSRDYFRPPPSIRKEMDNIYVHFLKVFVEFVVLLTRPGTIHLTHDSIRLLYLQFDLISYDSIIFFLISE